MNNGTFIISLDCELLWGSHYAGGERRFKYLKEGFTQYYDGLVKLLDEYEIRATFAYVGAVAMPRENFKDKVSDFKFLPKYRFWVEDLLVHSHCLADVPSWHNEKIIDVVLRSKQKHEIASHSFTHIRFSDFDDSIIAELEYAASHEILSKYVGERIKTFIFPENQISHLSEFKRSPYAIYRGKDDNWYSWLPFKRLFHFVDQMITVSPRPVTLKTDEYGNYYVPGSIMLFAYDGIRKLIPDWLRYIKIRRGIDRAIAEKGIFHLWFHPWNLGSSPRMIKLVEKILAYVSRCRNEGALVVSTVGDLLQCNNDGEFQ